MDNPLQILRDALELRGLNWDDMILVMAGIEHPEEPLDMAEWVVDNPTATGEEMMAEKIRLIIKYQKLTAKTGWI